MLQKKCWNPNFNCFYIVPIIKNSNPPVLFLLSCSACPPVLPVLLFCLSSCSACPVLSFLPIYIFRKGRADLPQGHAAWTSSMNKRGHAACHEAWTCIMHMQNRHAAWTCKMGIKHGNSVRKCSMNKQHGKAAGTCSSYVQQVHAAGQCSRYMLAEQCSMDIQQGHAAGTWSRAMPQGCAAGACSMDMHTPYSRPLLFPLPSRIRLRNRISNVVRHRERKITRIRVFFFRLGAFAFLALNFFMLSRSFLLCGGKRECAKKSRTPTSDKILYCLNKWRKQAENFSPLGATFGSRHLRDTLPIKFNKSTPALVLLLFTPAQLVQPTNQNSCSLRQILASCRPCPPAPVTSRPPSCWGQPVQLTSLFYHLIFSSICLLMHLNILSLRPESKWAPGVNRMPLPSILPALSILHVFIII